MRSCVCVPAYATANMRILYRPHVVGRQAPCPHIQPRGSWGQHILQTLHVRQCIPLQHRRCRPNARDGRDVMSNGGSVRGEAGHYYLIHQQAGTGWHGLGVGTKSIPACSQGVVAQSTVVPVPCCFSCLLHLQHMRFGTCFRDEFNWKHYH